MKIRSGFVSNSSSSSFIIAFKGTQSCKHCGRSDPDIIHMVRASSDQDYGETQVNAIGLDNVIDELKEWYEIGTKYASDRSMAQFINIVEKISGHLDSGYDVAIVSISYHNKYLNDIMSKENESIKVIAVEG